MAVRLRALGAIWLPLALIAATGTDAAAPPYRLTMLGGGTISDRDLHGRLVILNFWATWCAPCKRELADLDAFRARYGADRVAVIAIDAEPKPQARLLARQAAAMHIPIALGVEEGAQTYHPIRSAVPSTFVIDPAGQLILAQSGTLSSADLDRLAALVAASSAGRSGR